VRIVVCGGRKFNDWESLKATLDFIHAFETITELIEGGAPGADLLANCWGQFNGVKVTTVRAEWEKYGKKAGFIRNVKMAEMRPKAVVSFPGGSGTHSMITQARIRGIQVCEVVIREGSDRDQ
jgi:hypothetical protein